MCRAQRRQGSIHSRTRTLAEGRILAFDLPDPVEAEVEPLEVDEAVEARDPLDEVVVEEQPPEGEQRPQVFHLQDQPELETQRRRRLELKLPARRGVLPLALGGPLQAYGRKA